MNLSKVIVINLYINLNCVCLLVCLMQFFSAPRRPTLAREVENESS